VEQVASKQPEKRDAPWGGPQWEGPQRGQPQLGRTQRDRRRVEPAASREHRGARVRDVATYGGRAFTGSRGL